MSRRVDRNAREDVVFLRRDRPVARLVPIKGSMNPFVDHPDLRVEIPPMAKPVEQVMRDLRNEERLRLPYFDISAVLRYYRTEAHSEGVQELLVHRGEPISSSELTRLEFTSALSTRMSPRIDTWFGRSSQSTGSSRVDGC